MTSITTETTPQTPKNYVISQWDDEVLDLKPNLLRQPITWNIRNGI